MLSVSGVDCATVAVILKLTVLDNRCEALVLVNPAPSTLQLSEVTIYTMRGSLAYMMSSVILKPDKSIVRSHVPERM